MTSLTRRSVKEFTHLWKLEQLPSLLSENKEIWSPKIYVSASSWLQFCLDSAGTDLISDVVRLTVKYSSSLKVSLVNCDLTLDDLSMPSFKPVRILSLSLPGWKFHYNSNLERVKKGRFLFTTRLFVAENVNQSVEATLDLRKLSIDIGRLSDSANSRDLVLETSRGNVFRAHCAILSVRCPELLRLLNVLENEPSPRRRVLYTVPEEVLKVLLVYWYRGEFQVGRTDIEPHLRNAINYFKLGDLMSQTCAYPTNSTTITSVRKSTHNVVWPIKEMRFPIPKKVFNSPVFYPLEKVPLQIMLMLEPLEESGDIRVSVRLSPDFVPTSCSIHLKTALVDVFDEQTQVRSFAVNNQLQWNEVAILKRDDHEDILDGDTMTFHCEMTISQTVHEVLRNEFSDESIGGLHSTTYKDFSGLSASLKTLYESEKFADLILRAGDREFKLHNAVLSARAPKLLKLIQERRGFQQSDVIDEIPDVLNILLMYVYCGRVDLSNIGDATKLYLAASKYELGLLKKKCLAYIKSNITFS